MSKKVKRTVVTKRLICANTSPTIDIPINDAFKYFVNLKKIEGVRERTMKDYHSLMGYFTKWLFEAYPDIQTINQINVFGWLAPDRRDGNARLSISYLSLLYKGI